MIFARSIPFQKKIDRVNGSFFMETQRFGANTRLLLSTRNKKGRTLKDRPPSVPPKSNTKSYTS